MPTIRDATPDDYGDYTRLVRELGVDDPTPTHERFVAEILPRMSVAIDADRVVGYGVVEQLATTGYIRNVVTDPQHRRRGVGHALMVAARARFVAAGATMWCLNVKRDNVAAIALYESSGMTVAYRTLVMRLPREVALPIPDAAYSLAPLTAELDHVVEPQFRLLHGQLASARARPSRVVLALHHRDVIVGVGVMMPSVPGSFPFRLVDPQHAAAFIALLRAHAPPDAPWIQISAEADDALGVEVQRLGAYVNLDLLHLSGSL